MIAAPQLASEPCGDGRIRRMPVARPPRRSGTPVPHRLRPERVAWLMDAAIEWSRFGTASSGLYRWADTAPGARDRKPRRLVCRWGCAL